jgi:2-(1,2-epoxy-1,2-dihydrophenyl)acetyl-CoA isomerase
MITQYPHVETERDGAVLIVRLDNPAAHNALSKEMRYSLRDITRVIHDDQSIRCVYLTGKGKSFCAGGDLNMLVKAKDPWSVHTRFRHSFNLFTPFASLDVPVVCGVRGHAMGGGMGLALVSDLVIAGESAKFSAGFFRLGVVPDCLIAYTLPRLVGLAKARKFLFTNGSWSAQEAVDNDIALEVVADDDVDNKGIALAHKIAQGPANAMGLAKKLLLRSFESSIEEMMEKEGYLQVLAMSSDEFEEGLSAALEKRPADFLGAREANPLTDGMPSTVK